QLGTTFRCAGRIAWTCASFCPFPIFSKPRPSRPSPADGCCGLPIRSLAAARRKDSSSRRGCKASSGGGSRSSWPWSKTAKGRPSPASHWPSPTRSGSRRNWDCRPASRRCSKAHPNRRTLMLSHEDNERLVRVGKGTPLGELFRLYWIPFLPSKDLVKDGQPRRIRLLGEDLVAFRDSESRVGLVDQACPHRGAPLIFGRNEDCGLRCVYHGWKFDVTGAVTDMPAEPVRSRLKEHVRIKAYPCRERNGMIWTYMGPDGANPPPLPNLEWNLVPAEQVHVSVRVQECNWLQAVEGEIDSAHAPLLHGRLDSQGTTSAWIQKRDLRQTCECIKQDFGMSIAARRNYDANTLYWRVTQFILPFYTLVPPLSPFPDLSGHAWVPIDDENTLCIMFSYHPSQPLLPKTRQI